MPRFSLVPRVPATEPRVVFADLLARYRRRTDYSCNELARAVGVDPSYVSRLERAERPPPRRTIVLRLAAALELERGEAERLIIAAGYAPDWLVALAEQATITERVLPLAVVRDA